MLQIIQHILQDPTDTTKINLIYANVNADDILLKDLLDDLAAKNPQFNVYYVLNNPPEGWTGGAGFVTKEMIKEHCPSPAANMKILLCGPPPMIKAMCQNCEELGYDKANTISKLPDMVFKF
jgi:cytochrome-b5 reductase